MRYVVYLNDNDVWEVLMDFKEEIDAIDYLNEHANDTHRTLDQYRIKFERLF